MKRSIQNVLIALAILTRASALALDLDQAVRHQDAEASQILSTLGHSANEMTKSETNQKVTVAMLPRKKRLNLKH